MTEYIYSYSINNTTTWIYIYHTSPVCKVHENQQLFLPFRQEKNPSRLPKAAQGFLVAILGRPLAAQKFLFPYGKRETNC